MSQCPHCGAQLAQGAAYCSACGKQIAPAAAATAPAPAAAPGPASGEKKKSSSCGIWAIIGAVFALGVLSCGGIIAAILIPNFLDALEKARQKRTMADLRLTGSALMTFYVDEEQLPPIRDMDELAEYLEPDYLQELPRLDGWKNEIRISCWSLDDEYGSPREEAPPGGCERFALISAGADGEFEHDGGWLYEEEAFDSMDYDRDIVLVDGFLRQFPKSGSR